MFFNHQSVTRPRPSAFHFSFDVQFTDLGMTCSTTCAVAYCVRSIPLLLSLHFLLTEQPWNLLACGLCCLWHLHQTPVHQIQLKSFSLLIIAENLDPTPKSTIDKAHEELRKPMFWTLEICNQSNVSVNFLCFYRLPLC